MRQHPFHTSMTGRSIFLVLLIVAICIEVWFLRNYTPAPIWICLFNAAFLSVAWSATGYIGWGLQSYLQVWQAKMAWILTSQLLVLCIWYLLFSLTGLLEQEELMRQFPFYLVAGVLCSIILFLWYDTQVSQAETLSDEQQEIHNNQDSRAPEEKEEWIQHISVKNGTRIHVIPIEEIHYIEACGDYVTIFTASGQYVKEQTMKYFEANLPTHLFVRIHRSYILHVQQLLRIEQFGKESYHVRLRNGNSLRASSSGYKLLKQKLKL